MVLWMSIVGACETSNEMIFPRALYFLPLNSSAYSVAVEEVVAMRILSSTKSVQEPVLQSRGLAFP